MQEKAFLVFIEIRFRKSNAYGSATESITASKQQKIIKTAEYFLLKNPSYRAVSCRFDVVGISQTLDNPRFNWIKNAFQA